MAKAKKTATKPTSKANSKQNKTAKTSLDWQAHVYGTATDDLRKFAVGVKLPVHEWPWTPAARHAGFEENAVYLVRPDGYIGLARPTQDVEALRTYLMRFGIIAGTSGVGLESRL